MFLDVICMYAFVGNVQYCNNCVATSLYIELIMGRSSCHMLDVVAGIISVVPALTNACHHSSTQLFTSQK